MDEFRKLQKQECLNGGTKELKYGCSCCRKIKNIQEFRKWARKLAKSRLKNQDRKDLTENQD
jgi:hypothetical protein